MLLPEDAFPAASPVRAANVQPSRPSPSYEGALAGALGIVFGLFGVFSIGFIFVPIAALCSFFGLVRGLNGRSATGVGLSSLGGLLTFAGVSVSPTVWVMLAGLSLATSPSTQAPAPNRPTTIATALRSSLTISRKADTQRVLSEEQGQSLALSQPGAVIGMPSRAAGTQINFLPPSEPCTNRVIRRLPGRFLPDPIPQEIRVTSVIKHSRDGDFCVHEFSVADASNQFLSGSRLYLGEGHGQGQAFRDGRWIDPYPREFIDAEVVIFPPFANNLVLIKQSVIAKADIKRRFRLVYFSNRMARDLLKIAWPARLDVEIDGDVVKLRLWSKSACPDCPPNRVIQLKFDRMAMQMALTEPTADNIEIYNFLTQSGAQD